MGSCIVRVHSPQVKIGVEGRKDPVSSRRRSRGSRGKRIGKARVGKTRRRLRDAARLPAKSVCPKEPLAYKDRKGIRAAKVRLRRMAWIENRLSFVGETPEDLYTSRVKSWGPYGREEMKVRQVRLKRVSKTLISKKTPMPPGMSVNNWVMRLMELKYGTWSSVSPLLVDGDHSLGHTFEAPPSNLNRRVRLSGDRLDCLCCGRVVYSRRPVCRRCGVSSYDRFRTIAGLRDSLG
jgi:hypothetical protein